MMLGMILGEWSGGSGPEYQETETTMGRASERAHGQLDSVAAIISNYSIDIRSLIHVNWLCTGNICMDNI